MTPTHKIISFRNGMRMREDYVFNWLEADTFVEELMASSMYDEVRIVKLEKENEQ